MRLVLTKLVLTTSILISSTVAAFAVDVPEIDAMSGAAALGLVGAVGALLWERSRR